MRPKVSRKNSAIVCLAVVIFLIAGALLTVAQTQSQNTANPRNRDASHFDPNCPLPRELETSIRDGFTFVAVGDCIISRPMSQYAERETEFAAVVKILQQADATYGNMETTILDLRAFHGYPYSGPDDVTLVADPGVAKDLAKMGFDLVSRANNHALDWGVEGMRETSRHLDDAGLVYAGSGENSGLARAPQYFESAKGRVAIVSMASTFPPWAEALPAQGAAPGRPGINALKFKRFTVLPPEAMAQLAALARNLYPDRPWEWTEIGLVEERFSPTRQAHNFRQRFRNRKSIWLSLRDRPSGSGGDLKSIRQGQATLRLWSPPFILTNRLRPARRSRQRFF